MSRTDEYGVPTVATGSPATAYGFTGEPVDATGLLHLRARSYDPDLGRFTSRDTWPGTATASQAQNRYAYLANDPLNGTDPSGHCGVDVLADAAFVVFDLGSLVFGPEKDRGTNAMALGADIASVFVPCAAGAGMLVRAGAHVDDVADGMRGAARGVPNPKPVFKPSGAPDRNSPWYVSYRDADGGIQTVGNLDGVHAEVRIQQMRPGAEMSKPFGWRTVDRAKGPEWVEGTVCQACQVFPRGLFAPGTRGARGGPWGD
jgi:RHS repeat-associated protein